MQILAKHTYTSQTSELGNIRSMVQEIMEQQGCTEQDSKDAIMAINEACMNIIQHAYCGNPDGKIIIEMFVDNNDLVFRLIDFASPVDKSKCKSRDLDDVRPGGLGIHLIQSVMDDMQFQEPAATTGNILELRKTIAK
ncbi:MAG: ATP-binding protein [Gammaproteobacteria bacterium]|nr:ATP-binding protein [Gammaproteobacteria bacterium]